MKIDVKRFEYGTNFTISKLFIDGIYECFVLEDKVRELDGVPVSTWKIPNETAIPKGTYSVINTFSPHFNRALPLLVSVPGYEGVRIHPGNTDKNTEGCLLLGTTWAGSDFIGASVLAFDAFYLKFSQALGIGEQVQLQIGDSVRDFS